MVQLQTRKVEDSKAEQIYVIRAKHLNSAGRLFGGTLLAWIDELAGVVARRHSQCNITTAAIDNLQFKNAVYEGDMVFMVARLTYVGTTSMEIRVDSYIEELDGTRRMINQAYLVFVALDESGKPTRVPTLELETEAQKAEWEGGIKRKALRIQRKKEGF